MTDINLEELHDLLIKVAYAAGQTIRSTNPTLDNDTKKNSSDLVTETDRSIEKMVTSQLLGKYPNFAFIGEESYYPGMQLTEKPTFVVDPIDGTTNFIHGYPNVCISLAVLIGKVPTIGVVYNPFHGELYSAIKGCGGFVTKDNGEKRQLPLKKNPEPLRGLSNCIVGVEWGYDRTGQPFDLKARVFTKLAAAKEDGGSMVRGLKCIGSSALQLCYVATGQQDAWWEGGVWAWDVAAGACILAEAGGILVGGNPGDWECPIDSRKYLAIRPAPTGQNELVEEFWKVIGDDRMDYVS